MTDNLPVNALWQQLRGLMPVAETLAYMDHAAVAPIPAPARGAVQQWADEAAEVGDVAWPLWAARVESARELAAKLIGADGDEIAFVHNTTAGIGLVAEGFPWREGDNIVTLANEFPSNQYPWLNLASRGVETRRVEAPGHRVDSESIMQQCDDRTRMISVSWVGFASGWRLDLEDLVAAAHDRGILVFLDAIQGLGVFPLNVHTTPVDFLAADGHKWMLGPEGAGLFYIRQEHLDSVRPTGVGWNSVRHCHDFDTIALDFRPSARRFEGGTQNTVGILAMGASLQLLADMGLEADQSAVADQVLAVTDFACQQLQQAGARVLSHREGERRSGIVAFDMPGQDADLVRTACLDAGVVLSCRGGRLRISPHAYTNDDDIARLVDVVSSFN